MAERRTIAATAARTENTSPWGALEPKFWNELVGLLGANPAEVASPYDTDQWNDCADWLAERFAAKPRDTWTEIFAGTDACVAPVLSLTEAPEHPHSVARDSFIDIAGASVAAPVPRMSQTVPSPGEVGAIGADTADVLTELGYGPAEQDRLDVNGVTS